MVTLPPLPPVAMRADHLGVSLDDGRTHPAVAAADIVDAVAADRLAGFCIACGAESGPLEPDARDLVCLECREPGGTVFGAGELLFRLPFP